MDLDHPGRLLQQNCQQIGKPHVDPLGLVLPRPLRLLPGVPQLAPQVLGELAQPVLPHVQQGKNLEEPLDGRGVVVHGSRVKLGGDDLLQLRLGVVKRLERLAQAASVCKNANN